MALGQLSGRIRDCSHCVHFVLTGISEAGIVPHGVNLRVARGPGRGNASVTLTLLFAGGGAVADAAGKILPRTWTAFLALARITGDVIRREMCDTVL